MKVDTKTLQVEITIAPAERRKGGQRSSVSGSKVPDPPRVPRITRLMALAIKFQDMVDRKEVRDYADLARLGYVTRARITQIMNLLNLAPNIQEEILFLPSARVPRDEISERLLRTLCKASAWEMQMQVWLHVSRTRINSK